jgi:uncharacterized protein YeaO (DUF488 family)
MLEICTKRVYEPPNPADGTRILVDRIWPRGLTREQVRADLWLKDAAPSTLLRKSFHHDRSNWLDFKRRYFAELNKRPDVVATLLGLTGKGRLTLLFSARDTECNQAVALQEFLLAQSKG